MRLICAGGAYIKRGARDTHQRLDRGHRLRLEDGVHAERGPAELEEAVRLLGQGRLAEVEEGAEREDEAEDGGAVGGDGRAVALEPLVVHAGEDGFLELGLE